MNEPKRRGRPPKARIEGADVVALPVREMGVPGDFVLTEVQHTQPPVLMARDVICDAEQHKARTAADDHAADHAKAMALIALPVVEQPDEARMKTAWAMAHEEAAAKWPAVDTRVDIGEMVSKIDPDSFPPTDRAVAQYAQAYAMRVWNGQSPNVPRNERIKRVKAALVGQNLPTEGIELP